MNKLDIPFTYQLWQEIQTFSVLGAWRYSKGIYTLHRSVLSALTDIPCASGELILTGRQDRYQVFGGAVRQVMKC